MAETRKPHGPETPLDEMLEEALALARAEAARPAPDALMARVLADAARVAHPARTAGRRQGRLAASLAALGGWPALGGLATAGMAGLWLGLSPPAAVEDLGGWLGAEGASADLLLPDDYFSDTSEG